LHFSYVAEQLAFLTGTLHKAMICLTMFTDSMQDIRALLTVAGVLSHLEIYLNLRIVLSELKSAPALAAYY
jgi:hypothetical protein